MRCTSMFALLTGILSFAATTNALGAEESLAARLPADPNAVMTVDVAHLMQSSWAKNTDLKQKLTSGFAGRPLPVPATAKRVAVGARLLPNGMHSLWQAAVIELPSAPKLEPMLRKQGGYLDLLAGKQAAWTPQDVFYIALDAKTLGVVRPSLRPAALRWAEGQYEKKLSAYLTIALSSTVNADAVFAFDLHDTVSPASIEYALSMGQLASLEKIEKDQDKLISALASVTGMTISIRASDKLNGRWVIDFDKDISAIGKEANQLVIEVLTLADVYEPDMGEWSFKASGNRLIGEREVDEENFQRLVGMLAPAHAGDASDADAGAEAKVASQSSPKDKGAVASQRYYQAVAKMLDGLGTQASPTQTAGAITAKARKLQQLPVLDVDPALLTWGNSVYDTLVRASQVLAVGQGRAQAAAAGVASPVAYTTYNYNGSGGSDSPETRAAYRNAQQQRRQVSQTERAAAAQQAFAIINEILPSRGKVRAEMTQKYNVEF